MPVVWLYENMMLRMIYQSLNYTFKAALSLFVFASSYFMVDFYYLFRRYTIKKIGTGKKPPLCRVFQPCFLHFIMYFHFQYNLCIPLFAICFVNDLFMC